MTKLSIFDFGFSSGHATMGNLKRSWVTRLVDFLLGPSSTPHPIYTVGVAAGFADGLCVTEKTKKPKSERRYVEDSASEAIYVGLAGAGLASYGFVAPSEEHENGRR